MTESRPISTFARLLHAVKRRAEGSALLIGVGLVAIAAALAAPRATEPLALALPLPSPNRTNLALITRADRERADEARRHALSFAVRSVGEMLRRVGEASARRGGNAEAALGDLRALTARALATEGDRGLLALRAVQAELFVRASRAFAESGTVSPELRELGGDFPELATTSGWRSEGKLLLSAEELALLFRMRWNDLTGLASRPPFAATLDEYRDRYALLLRHPSGESDAVRLQRQLGYVAAVEKLDHDYPAAFARGVLLYRSAAYEASAAAFRMHLELRPNGPWALRARNHLLAALAQAESSLALCARCTKTEPPMFELPSDRRLVGVLEAAREALAKPGGMALVGAAGSGPALLARALLGAGASHVLYVAPNHDVALRAAEDLRALAALSLRGLEQTPNEPAPLLLTTSETSPYADVHPDRRQTMQRAAALFTIARGLPWQSAVATPGALLRRAAPPSALVGAGVELVTDGELDVEATAYRLTAAGYLRTPVVEDPGGFAVRGGVLDIWPASASEPLRVELLGDMILSLKRFDPDTQRTTAELSSAWLPPAREAILDPAVADRARASLRHLCDEASFPSTKARALIDDLVFGRSFFGSEGYLPAFYELVPLLSYLPAGAVVVIEDPPTVARALVKELEQAATAEAARSGQPHFPVSALYAGLADIEQALEGRVWVGAHRAGVAGTGATDLVSRLESAPADAASLAQDDHAELARAVKLARTAQGKHAALDPLIERIRVWQEQGLRVVPVAKSATQAERIGTLLQHRGLELEVTVAPLGRGVLAPLEQLVLVTDEEIFGPRALRAPARRTSTRALLEDLRALAPGDFVVHVEHGIGRYVGLERREVAGVGLELIVVEYAGGDKLFLPVYRLNQVQKYSGSESAPKLDRLGGLTFAKTKASVARRVRQMADELLRLYAERAALVKTPVLPADDDYHAFEASFPFEETRDQAAAISEVMKDLESSRVMDRLVCGDVGFGKTEVALRAAFLMAQSGRQVAVLCPTTVLAQQHFQTFSQRFADWPLTVRVLSRFSSKGEQLETVKRLKEGKVDVVVGTHRLLSKDVHFKHLGLLVVDEEQRFGVTHKERIKQLRASVDVLTLSATPIPRTLQLAVGGMRDMSIIATPPVDRRTIRTITSQFDPTLVREAVEQELARGGQIFYVYNRVEGIYERAERLAQLVPGARIAVAHGRLSEDVLERTMYAFVNGEYDVLVATAIIESGLDIPRANTIVIDRADMLGLSQLYQLRGRVGRARERAYCYLLVPPPSQLSDEARQRLEALERFSELGSGFHLATLDMELRGAGDVLGAEQSGFAASVGFELFCRMLDEATRELRGETVVHDVEPELHFDVEALLATEYVAEVGVRLSLYKRFASAIDEAEIDDLAQELENRFGPPPLEARRFVELMRLKCELRRLRVLGCEASAKSVTFHLRDDTPLDPAKVRELVGRKRSPYKLTPEGRLTRRLLETEAAADGLVLATKALEELAGCVSAAT